MSDSPDRAASITRKQLSSDDLRLLNSLRESDEAAFAELVERYHSLLLNLARLYVSNQAAAEDVVQETWLAVLKGIDRFESRSSLKTWISRILINRAKTRAKRDGKLVPFSSLLRTELQAAEPAVEPERFQTRGGSK